MDQFCGKFKRQSVENYEAFLSALGINFAMRKAALLFNPNTEIEYDSNTDTWQVHSDSIIFPNALSPCEQSE